MGDLQRRVLELDFHTIEDPETVSTEPKDEMSDIARGLPSNLRKLRVLVHGRSHIGDRGLTDLAQNLPSELELLELGLAGTGITDAGVKAIAERLPSSIQWLFLGFDACRSVTRMGARDLSAQLPRFLKLRGIDVDFSDTAAEGGCRFESVSSLTKWA